METSAISLRYSADMRNFKKMKTKASIIKSMSSGKIGQPTTRNNFLQRYFYRAAAKAAALFFCLVFFIFAFFSIHFRFACRHIRLFFGIAFFPGAAWTAPKTTQTGFLTPLIDSISSFCVTERFSFSLSFTHSQPAPNAIKKRQHRAGEDQSHCVVSFILLILYR